uniref:ABC transporter domain-containing protein n=1 Tax=Oryza punctata TaxID=4537 RepID=A0A0E0JZB8_ORYPU
MTYPIVDIISWNVRGLNRPARRTTVRETLQMARPHIACLQETKMRDIDARLAASLGAGLLPSFRYKPAMGPLGTRGGILVLWNDDVVDSNRPPNDQMEQLRLGRTMVEPCGRFSQQPPHPPAYFGDLGLLGNMDNSERFLRRLRDRIDMVGIELPKIEIRYEQLSVQADAFVASHALPTLSNAGLIGQFGSSNKKIINILKQVNGILKPSRMTLLLGPPSSGKSTLVRALTRKLHENFQVSGNITYYGHKFSEFYPERTSTYVSQHDLHNAELTIREMLDFSRRCLGIRSRYDMLTEISRRERNAGIKPNPEIDAFMKATAMQGHETSIITDVVLKVLGLDICADIIVGDEMIRGISGGQVKRVTTGEMLTGPARALLMDEISTGLDSSSTFQIKDTQFIMDHGRISWNFWKLLASDALKGKEWLTSYKRSLPRKTRNNIGSLTRSHIGMCQSKSFAERFKSFHIGQQMLKELHIPFEKSKTHPAILTTMKNSLSNWESLKVVMSREKLLMKRNSFHYIFKVTTLIILSFMSMTVFLRTKMPHGQFSDGTKFLGALTFNLITVMFNGLSELNMTVKRLPVFYKHRDYLFFPPWTFGVANILIKIPVSFVEAAVWVIITYYVIGFAPDVESQNAISVNEFLASRWAIPNNETTLNAKTIGEAILMSKGLLTEEWGFWLSIAALEMKQQGITESRLQLLYDTSGTFRPGVLTALVGVSGAGKTTLMDVVAGRKTSGTIEENITLSGYPKKQETFARISGYCEQADIHSPNVTVYESILYSAWLRLSSDVDSNTRKMFVDKVMALVELDLLRNAMVGLPGVSGLSTEQRKRLMIAVELVANPSIIFMDEPTSGLDARAAAIVMRTELSIPPPGFQDLLFATKYSQSFYTQCVVNFWKQYQSYWKNPPYNGIRYLITFLNGLFFGTQDLYNLVGATYAAMFFIGATNCMSVQPVVSIERAVFYRENAAGMYSPMSYAFAQASVEFIYNSVQGVLYTIIIYPMIGYNWTASKFFYFLFFIISSFNYFTFFGMMLVACTPSALLANILITFALPLWNLFAGFLIVRKAIPIWRRWYYWADPVSWTIYGVIASHIGGNNGSVSVPDGRPVAMKQFLDDKLGFRHDFLGYVILAHFGFMVIFVVIFGYSIKFLNFQKR